MPAAVTIKTTAKTARRVRFTGQTLEAHFVETLDGKAAPR